jgi:alpha-mannosidase
MGYAEPGLIVRLYEIHGEKAEAKIELPWAVDAREVDLIERPAGKVIGSGTSITVPLAPFEIKTLRLQRR